eukprot:jgi/Bigna1/147153/aug1.130_g21861
MPNVEYVAVRCFNCATFQSMQRTKLGTFKCKLCNEKQSLKKVYAISDRAKDIRKVVQDLNMHRMVAQDVKYQKTVHESSSSNNGQGRRCLVENQISMDPPRISKWEAYMPQNDKENDGSEDENYEAVLSAPTPSTGRSCKENIVVEQNEVCTMDINTFHKPLIKKDPRTSYEV